MVALHGDLGRYDEEGDFYYIGCKNDNIRRRGKHLGLGS
jgi:acyl-coenzyme A synthetase/AMP-(fatty) acid ligase